MSYQVLARKWRPQNFKQMVGQEHVLRALMNALDSDRLHHAYLFTGTRGVGKTTIARILTKCLNCETGVTSKPCGECNSCTEIAAGNFLDLIEVDAASRTKVDDTRELLENVQYAPTRARFKVYLIDEVHMLSGHSFNALLKTLEEPPPHVKFLFATTDPQKLPATVLSRCLQFNLKRMPVDMISGHLDYLLQQESIKFEDDALRLLARAADGSMRDALSLLDQSIAFSGDVVSEASVRDMLGTISNDPLIDLLKLILAEEGAELLQQIDALSSVTPDFAVAADALIMLLHQLAVQQVVPNAINEDKSITELAQQISKEEVQLFYQIAIQGRKDLPLSPDPRSGFEMMLLRMMSFRPLREGMQVQQDYNEIEDKKKTIISEQTNEKNVRNNDAVSLHKKIADSEIQKPEDSPPVKSIDLDKETPPWEDVPEYLNQASNTKTIDEEVSDNNKTKYNTVNSLNEDKESQQTKNESKDDNEELISGSIEDLILNTDLSADLSKNDDLESDNSERFQKAAIIDSVSDSFDPNQPWHAIVPQLKLSGRANELIKHCLLNQNQDGIISLSLNKDREDLYADTTKQEIQQAIHNLFGENTHLKLSIADNTSHDSSNSTSNNNDKSLETPAQRSTRKDNELQQQAESNIETDPFVIALKDRFGAQIVRGSVKPK